jgi:hypothetical protein
LVALSFKNALRDAADSSASHLGCPALALGIPHPGCFSKKRLDLLDGKGVDVFGDAKESAN